MKPRPTVITVCLILIFHCVNEVDAADCNRTAPQPITHIELPGNPFAPIPTRDGCWIFVSLARTQSKPGRIAVLKRDKGNVSIVRTVPVEDSPAGMVMTHDGKILIAAVGPSVAFPDSLRLISGQIYFVSVGPRRLSSSNQFSTTLICGLLCLVIIKNRWPSGETS